MGETSLQILPANDRLKMTFAFSQALLQNIFVSAFLFIIFESLNMILVSACFAKVLIRSLRMFTEIIKLWISESANLRDYTIEDIDIKKIMIED